MSFGIATIVAGALTIGVTARFLFATLAASGPVSRSWRNWEEWRW